MKKNIWILLLALAGSKFIYAQSTTQTKHEEGFSHFIRVGYHVGALSPTSLPNTIRKVKSFNPLFNPSIGYECLYKFNKQWSVGAGISIDYKGMRVKDSVIYFHTIVTMEQDGQRGEFEGDFSGTNETFAHNSYITLPVYAVYEPGKWRYKLGVYFAQMISSRFDGTVSNGYIRNGNSLGEKVLVQTASFDFAKTQRTFDWGLHAGIERKIGKRWAATAQLQWGMRPIFPSSFKGMSFSMYNIFAALGASYRL